MADWPYNTARWQRLRKLHLSVEPMCRGCNGRGRLTLANTVDHVRPISEGGPAFPGHDGLASYCPACHSAKTARGTEAGAAKSRKPRRGCDADGNPIDPEHAWNDSKPGPNLNERSLRADGLGTRPNLFLELVAKGSQNGG